MKKGGKKVSLLPVRRGDTNSKSNLTAKSSRLTEPVVTQFSQNCISQTGYKDNNRRVRIRGAGQCKEVSENKRVQEHVSGVSRRCVDVLAKEHSKEKSLFREIKKRYAETRGTAPPINDDFSSIITQRVRTTTGNIGCISQHLRQAIKTEVKIINEILAGRLHPPSEEEPSSAFYSHHVYLPQQDCAANSDSGGSNQSNMSNCKRPHIEATVTTKDGGIVDRNTKPQKKSCSKNKENVHPTLKFPCIPESSWIFQTPPNRKLNFDHIKTAAQCQEEGLQPAVLQTGRERTVVYEMNKRINVDLSNFDHKQNVNIDRRVMMQVATVSHVQHEEPLTTDSAAMVIGDEQVVERFKETRFVFPHVQETEQEVEMMQTSPSKFQLFQSDPYELENHFLALTCRPKKVVSNLPRALGLKRKRDIFEVDHQCGGGGGDGKSGGAIDAASVVPDGREFDSDFGLIGNVAANEESFTYKFTGGGAGGDGATMTGCYLFDFEGNTKDSFDFRLGDNN